MTEDLNTPMLHMRLPSRGSKILRRVTMKTEQEQIKAIKQIIDERVETTFGQVQGRHGNVIKTVDTVIIARDIVNAGYGDVSEYKAEIERLEEKCEELRNEKWNAQDDLDCYCDEMPNKIKQAQIKILNKANERLNVVSREFGDDCDLCGVSAVCSCRCEINNLIKEIEND